MYYDNVYQKLKAKGCSIRKTSSFSCQFKQIR